MKKVLGALLLVIAVAFTSTVSASTNDNIPIGVEYVVSVNSVDFVAVATDVPTVPTGIVVINVADKSVNYVASVEGLVESVPIVNVALINGIVNRNLVASVEGLTENSHIVNGILNDKLVSNDNVASVEGLIKVFSLSRGNSTNGTEFVKIFLPVEVGLSNSNILNT